MLTTIKHWTPRILVAALIPGGLSLTTFTSSIFAQQCEQAVVIPTTICNDGPGLGGGYEWNDNADGPGLGGGYAVPTPHHKTICQDGPGLGGGY